MSELNAPDLPPHPLDSPGASQPDFVAASAQQVARLRYLGVDVQEPVSNDDACCLIDQTNHDPAFAEKIESWESEKELLHPDLFRIPPRFAGLSVPFVPAAPAEPSPYAPIAPPPVPAFVPTGGPGAMRPARRSAAKFVVAVAIIAVLGAAGWFLWQSPWLSQALNQLSAVAGGSSPSSSGPAAPGQPAATVPAPAAAALSPEEFKRRVAESQRLAVARYPALGTTTSEINMRFVHRYKLMLGEHNARLQDPNWPMLLADDCAAASGIKAAGSATKSAVASNRSR